MEEKKGQYETDIYKLKKKIIEHYCEGDSVDSNRRIVKRNMGDKDKDMEFNPKKTKILYDGCREEKEAEKINEALATEVATIKIEENFSSLQHEIETPLFEASPESLCAPIIRFFTENRNIFIQNNDFSILFRYTNSNSTLNTSNPQTDIDSSTKENYFFSEEAIEITTSSAVSIENKSSSEAFIKNIKSLEVSIENTKSKSKNRKRHSRDDQASKKGVKKSDKEKEERLDKVSLDKRYLLFLKRTNPSLYKKTGDVRGFIKHTEDLLEESAKINEAKVELNWEPSEIEVKEVKIEDIWQPLWTKEENDKFKGLVIKHKNNFFKISAGMEDKPINELVLKYYINKDKTFKHIKKKPGRMSDIEMNEIVQIEWSQDERRIFKDNFKTFGKTLNKYQTVLHKNIKDLNIFLRWFIKNEKKLEAEKPKVYKNILDDWNVDERQLFAIYYPYYNKSWIKMSTHFTNKSHKDLRQYYQKYFKHLSYNEQKFESVLQNASPVRLTDPVKHIGNQITLQDEWSELVGWIMKNDM